MARPIPTLVASLRHRAIRTTAHVPRLRCATFTPSSSFARPRHSTPGAVQSRRHLLTEVRQLLSGHRDGAQQQQQQGTAAAAAAAAPSSAFSPAAVVAVGALVFLLYPNDTLDDLSEIQKQERRAARAARATQYGAVREDDADGDRQPQTGAWYNFSSKFESLLPSIVDVEWSKISDSIVDFILPEWSKMIPGYMRKLQRELSMAPGSLADEIWKEAHDPEVNPEIRYRADVRVSEHLCAEEKAFLANRRRVTTMALARYLGIDERDVNPDDVPVMAMCSSGGGLRALVASAGSMMAAQDDGLLDCLTYTAGVSGSCWLQLLYNSSVAGHDLHRLVDHLKARLGIHIAYPPVAFQSLLAAPTNKHLLSGIVEKLKGDPSANLGLVDAYGILLAARLLVPRGELGVNERDFKLSNQRRYIQNGEHPMPIYTAVRHEIPDVDANSAGPVSEAAKEQAKKESWFQWFEVSPFELFCEEFNAGIPTWAMGRKFSGGKDVPAEHGFHLPELRVPMLMGIFGSAFCATLSHYYREVRPIMRSIAGLGTIDDMISGRNEDLSKLHPIDPASIPNFVYGMQGQLGRTVPPSVCRADYLSLMDAGISNNLPIYPLLRPGRNVDVVIAFDASTDTKTDNWLAAVDGYARQRGIKGWPVGAGWPQATELTVAASEELEHAMAKNPEEAQAKLEQAKAADQATHSGNDSDRDAILDTGSGSQSRPEDLGYCTVWVGTTEEHTADNPSPTPCKALDDKSTWRLTDAAAGIAVAYMPLLANPRVPGVLPGTATDADVSDYLSTWNFVYTPDQVDAVVALAKANYDEGREQVRVTVRAVYERKKKAREQREAAERAERRRLRMRRGMTHSLGEGDHFS